MGTVQESTLLAPTAGIGEVVNTAKGRKHGNCACPIWVDVFLSGKEVRESLKARDWRKAQEIVREWETEDRRSARPQFQ